MVAYLCKQYRSKRSVLFSISQARL
nr:unnamed protein product [Callosobruchus analis]